MGINLNLDLTQQPKVVLQVKMMGVYAAGTDYAVGDAVTYNGGVYYMHTDAAAGTAPTDTAAWQAINSPQAYIESLDVLTLTNGSTSNTISVIQNDNVGTDVSTDGAIHINNSNNTGIALAVYSTMNGSAEAPLVRITATDVAFDQDLLRLVQAGTGGCIYADPNGNVGTGRTSNGAIFLTNTGNTGIGLNVYTNIADTMGASLVTLTSDNVAADQAVLDVQQDGTDAAVKVVMNGTPANTYDPALLITVSHAESTIGAVRIDDSSTAPAIFINKTSGAAGAHIRFTGDPNPTSADGDFWFDGTNLKINKGGTVHTINTTAV